MGLYVFFKLILLSSSSNWRYRPFPLLSYFLRLCLRYSSMIPRSFTPADHPNVWGYITEGVPIWVCGGKLLLRQQTWSVSMYILSAINISCLSVEWSDQARTQRNYLMQWFDFNAKFVFKSILNRDLTASHYKHPICPCPAADTGKLTCVWSRYFGIGLLTGTGVLAVTSRRWKYFDK